MPIQNLTPNEAQHVIAGSGDVVLIDVRTTGEFAQGHPAGAVNIPWALADARSGMLTPNPEFVGAVLRLADVSKTLVISCQSGGRSANACRDLSGAGYQNLVNVLGGFGGGRDLSGRVVPGWRDSGLPIER